MRILFLVGLAGCVSKGRYEIAEVQRDATRIALSARTADATRASLESEAAKASLAEEIAARQLQLDALSAEAATLRAERDALLAAKAAWLVSPATAPAELAEALVWQADRAREASVAASRASEVSAAFAPVVARGCTLEEREGSVVVVIPSRLLFQEGWTTLSPRGEALAADVVAAVAQLPGRRVTLVGHTGAAAVHTSALPSAWERGLLPAVTLARVLAVAADVPLTVATRAAGDPRAGLEDDRVELWLTDDPQARRAFSPQE